MRVVHEATPAVFDALQQVGRTEDVRFSPSNRRLAIAGFLRDAIAILSVEIRGTSSGPEVALTEMSVLESERLSYPHGVEFLDEDTLLVANRAGDLEVLRITTSTSGLGLSPVELEPSADFRLLISPGSLVVNRVDRGRLEVIVCNNFGGTLTRHLMDGDVRRPAVLSNEVLLRRRLNIPDGVALSPCGTWLAVSNHGANVVMMYERSTLAEDSEPTGILRGALYPHGLRFTADGRHLVVADAGRPHLHVFARPGDDWTGVQHPAASIRAMSDEDFRRGLHNPEEGGPKGIDVDRDGQVLVSTSEYVPLAFFDLGAMLAAAEGGGDPALAVRYELDVLDRSARAAERATRLEQSRSFRVTKPMRRAHVALKRWQRVLGRR